MFEVGGALVPLGKALSHPAEASLVAVRFITAAETPAAGMPPCPATWKLSDPAGPRVLKVPRVSRILVEGVGRKIPAVPVLGAPGGTRPPPARAARPRPAPVATPAPPP